MVLIAGVLDDCAGTAILDVEHRIGVPGTDSIPALRGSIDYLAIQFISDRAASEW